MRATIGINNFRLFKREAEICLRPLTLFYGRNQSGKSSVLRLLVAIGESMRAGSPVFAATSPALLPAGLEKPTLKLLTADSAQWLSISYDVDVRKEPVPNRVRIGNREEVHVDLFEVASGVRTPAAYKSTFEGRIGTEQSVRSELEFGNLFPKFADGTAAEVVQRILHTFEPLRESQWLAMTRPTPPQHMSQRVRWVVPDGAGLATEVHTNPKLRRAIRDCLRTQLELSLDLDTREFMEESDPLRRIVFTLAADGQHSRPLDQAGEGLRWLIPMVACGEWARLAKAGAFPGPSCLLIEEPEARLHPNLQIPLAKYLFKLVTEGVPCIVETHSVYFLRSLQLAVLEGVVSPDEVALHWFDEPTSDGGNVAQIRIKSDGTLEGWRPDVFEEEQELSRQIFEQRWKRKGQA